MKLILLFDCINWLPLLLNSCVMQNAYSNIYVTVTGKKNRQKNNTKEKLSTNRKNQNYNIIYFNV